MTTTIAAVPVTAHVPAGAARLAAEHLASAGREAARTGDTATMREGEILDTAAAALHRAGWAEDGYPLASAAMQRDEFLDAPGPSVHLNGDVADALLKARGWTIHETPHTRRGVTHTAYSYTAPDGVTNYWSRDEALTLALTAEAFALGLEA